MSALTIALVLVILVLVSIVVALVAVVATMRRSLGLWRSIPKTVPAGQVFELIAYCHDYPGLTIQEANDLRTIVNLLVLNGEWEY